MNPKAKKLLKALGMSQEENISLTLQEVNKQLEAFNKVINIQPLIKAVNDLQSEFSSRTKDLESQFSSKVRELKLSIPADKTGQLLSEIGKVSTQLITSQNESDSALLKAKAELQKEFQDKIKELRLVIDSSTKELQDKKEFQSEIKKLNETIIALDKKINNRINNIGGGSMNRKITFGGVDYLTRYTDINYKAGNNVTFTVANNDQTKMVDVTITASGSGSGIVRSINNISGDTTAGAVAATDYVYLCTGTLTLTLPTAVGNTNLYTIKNVGTGVVTIATTAAQTIDGSSTIIMPTQYTSVDVVSDTANWNVT